MVQAQPVYGGDIRDGDDLVGLHDVAADAGDARVRLVVDEQVAPVVGAVRVGHVHVVRVAVLEAGRLAEDALALVGLAPSGGAVAVEHRDPHELAHGRDAEHADLAPPHRRP